MKGCATRPRLSVAISDLLAFFVSAPFVDLVAGVSQPLDQLNDLIRGDGNHVVVVAHWVGLGEVDSITDNLNINSFDTLLHTL